MEPNRLKASPAFESRFHSAKAFWVLKNYIFNEHIVQQTHPHIYKEKENSTDKNVAYKISAPPYVRNKNVILSGRKCFLNATCY